MAKAWTAARRAKFRATMKTKRAQRADLEADYPNLKRQGKAVGLGIQTADGWKGDRKPRKVKPGVSPTNDAIIYLRHSRDAIAAEVRGGRKALITRAERYAMLALDALEGV